VITVQQISKSFDGVAAVTDVSFDVAPGEAVALVGASGSGKTTVLRLIAGLETPDRGSVILGGRVVSTKDWVCPPYERGIGMVFQKPALWPHMTLAQNIAFGISGDSKSAAEQRLRTLLRLTHLEGLEQRYPHQVSGGEAQRASLARALASSPAILFLDEPMAGLDEDLVKSMIELLHEVRRTTGVTVIYVSHHLDEAREVTGRVLVLARGRLSYDGAWERMRLAGGLT
jgi:ABC-type sulfate/molybdate transport systems ATPase subunit